MSDDGHYMRKALALAERGRGTTSPNPMVGALVVDDEGVIVGRGAHRVAGGPHAEVIALEDAGRARARGDAVLHARAVLAHWPHRPVRAARRGRRDPPRGDRDRGPNPLVNGRGLAHLRERGVEVTVGVERARAAAERGLLHRIVRSAGPT